MPGYSLDMELNTCLPRLPTNKTVFVILIVLTAAATLIVINLSEQLTGQQGQSARKSWQISATIQNIYDAIEVLLDECSTGSSSTTAIASTHGVTDSSSIKERKPLKPTKKTKSSQQRLSRNFYLWNHTDPNSYKGLPLRGRNDRKWKHEEALIYNRVGKCGSRTVRDLLLKLSIRNNFNFVSSTVYNATSIDPSHQFHIAQVLDSMKTPYVFERHLHFLDFAEFNLKQPMYINIIRDPLDRFVSSYYFNRFGDGRIHHNYRHSVKRRYRSVTDCILQRRSECAEKVQMYIIPFFCGQNDSCRIPGQWALDRAKENVEKHFVAVGILEDLESTFRLFEKLLPQFFKGIMKLYHDPDLQQWQINFSTLTKFKEDPSPEAVAVMKPLLKYEYEFYYFVKDRLEGLKKQYDIE